jgi:hypothetical protein
MNSATPVKDHAVRELEGGRQTLLTIHSATQPCHPPLKDYKKHVNWKADGKPGGLEELNLKFIAEFDLALLDDPAVLAMSTEAGADALDWAVRGGHARSPRA